MRIAEWWDSGQVVPVELATGATARLFVRVAGAGDGGPDVTVTFLHGWPTSSWDFQSVEAALAGTAARLVFVDLLGFGASDKPDDHRYSIFEQADLVAQVWRHLGVTATVVVAHDYGAIVAQELLARHGDGANPVALTGTAWLNASLYPDLHQPTPLQIGLLDPATGPGLAASISRELFDTGFTSVFGPHHHLTDEDLADQWAGIARGRGPLCWPALLAYVAERREQAARWVTAFEASAGTPPSRFVWGLADELSGAPVVEHIRSSHPDAPIDVLTDVGHYPHIEQPQTVAAAIAALLDGG